jgi:hypothetical protein
MTNTRRALALAGAAAMLGGLTACGGESGQAATEQYCASVKAAQQELETLRGGDPRNVQRAVDRMQDLAEQAPPAVADEWRTLDGAFSGVEQALEKAGLGFGDLADPQRLRSLAPQQARELTEQARRLGAQRFSAASTAIQQHAQKTCGVRLGGLR